MVSPSSAGLREATTAILLRIAAKEQKKSNSKTDFFPIFWKQLTIIASDGIATSLLALSYLTQTSTETG
jgi:hypothetical protein